MFVVMAYAEEISRYDSTKCVAAIGHGGFLNFALELLRRYDKLMDSVWFRP